MDEIKIQYAEPLSKEAIQEWAKEQSTGNVHVSVKYMTREELEKQFPR